MGFMDELKKLARPYAEDEDDSMMISAWTNVPGLPAPAQLPVPRPERLPPRPTTKSWTI